MSRKEEREQTGRLRLVKLDGIKMLVPDGIKAAFGRKEVDKLLKIPNK